MREKNCIITGGTSGLGLSLVKKFINNGFFVHIIARDNTKIKKLLNYFYERNFKNAYNLKILIYPHMFCVTNFLCHPPTVSYD